MRAALVVTDVDTAKQRLADQLRATRMDPDEARRAEVMCSCPPL